MGDLSLKCPLCCNQTFDSKLTLIQHLANILNNLTCPICDNKWSSLAHLIEHLNLDDCQNQLITNKTLDGNHEISIETSVSQANHSNIENSFENVEIEKFESHDSPEITQMPPENSHIGIKLTHDPHNEGKMFVEYVNHQKSNPMLQASGLKLLTEDGVIEQFVLMSPNNEDLSKWGSIVTKQNDDGTISVTTVNDTKESETVIAPSEVDMEDNQELYSCNTCGVSFSSVAEHIQNYHNDQEVVVEEPIEDNSSGLVETLEYDSISNEVLTETRPKTTRQIITDTGKIIVTSLTEDNTGPGTESEVFIVPNDVPKEKLTCTQGKRFVQIDKFCDSMVKNINPDSEKEGAFHRVIVNEVRTAAGEKQKSYSCLSCKTIVEKLEDFELHPCKPYKYQCVYCSVGYNNSKSLCAHMKVHKVKGDGKIPLVEFECGVCNTTFQSNKSLKLHKRMHDPVKARLLEPPLETADGSEGTNIMHKCPICEKMIPVDFLDIHQESHRSTENLNCTICNKKFFSAEYLQMHMTVHNMGKIAVNSTDKVLPYSCSYCDRKFVRPHEKVKHERIHTGEKPHSCEICGKSFRVSYCLTLHMRTHTGARPYTCAHCGKRFKAHSAYNHHLLTHSEVRAYKCPSCPKAFKTSVQLAGHKNSHTKPFSCPHCNRPFASLYALRVHSQTHARQNNLKFSCSLCGASYARAFALKDHGRKAHQQDVDALEVSTVNIFKNGDVETIALNSKDLTQEISELGMSPNELIDAIKVAN